MRPNRLSILGVGLLGGSIGLAVRERLKGCKIAGYGHRPATLKAALALGALDQAYEDAPSAVHNADLVILCTPVGTFPSLLREIAGELRQGTVITDVGSTKRTIVESAEKALPAGARFVGSHPIAGSEKRGVEFARPDLFDGALCITTPTSRTSPEALATVEQFWQTLGMRITRMPPDEHDRLLADVSHLPHAVAAALVSIQDEPALKLSGKGFADLTRIAAGDPGLWRDILLDNRDNVRQGLDRLISELQRLSNHLSQEDGQALQAWLEDAATRRRSLGISQEQS